MVENYYSFFEGDELALKRIIDSYSKQLYRFIISFVSDNFVAEDILEDVFLSLIIKKRKLEDEMAFKSYLFKTARNKCYDYINRHKNKFTKLDERLPDEGCSLDEIANKEFDKKLVAVALEKLSADHYCVIYLSFFEQMKNKEIAKIMKKTQKQVENLLFNAKIKLKKILKEIGYED